MSLISWMYSRVHVCSRLSEAKTLAMIVAPFLVLLSGCGSNMSTKAGTIQVTYATGVTAGELPVLNSATLSMTPLNDKTNYGVDWTLTCGGDAQSGYVTKGCGTLLPAHTAGGVATSYTAPGTIPDNVSVTITARVTSNPSQQASVSITIVNPTIAITADAGSTSLAVSGNTTVVATIANDVNTLGAKWTVSCSSNSCGSFSSRNTLSGVETKYTAPTSVPTGGTVTLTATSLGDETKSKSIIIKILPITVSVSPSVFNIATAATESLTATVTNDVQSAGVMWSCGSSNCGTFSSQKTASGVATVYTAPSTYPSSNVITITATSVSDATTAASSIASVSNDAVISVVMTRTMPSSLAEGKTATFSASVSGDATNAGIDWAASCGSSTANACGNFSKTTTTNNGTTIYTAPTSLPPTNPVTITATAHAYTLDPTLKTNIASGNLTITAPASIALIQQPSTSISTSEQTSISATVTNDATQGGVTWTVQCSNTTAGACGYVSPYTTVDGATATYVAPPVAPGVPVTVVATSTAYPSLSVQSAAITVTASTAHTISFIPYAPSRLLDGSTAMLNAAVSNDASNSGVDWEVCASNCGFFTVKAAVPAIVAVPPSPGDPGSPAVPAEPAVTATSVQGWPNGLPIAYTAPTVVPASGDILITVSSTADRLNNLSSAATAVATVALVTDATGPELHGVVHAGSLPVVGASVYLYAAGTSGYASTSTPVYNPSNASFATTDATGSFTISAGYTCPSETSQLYLVALGGKAGTQKSNSNLSLMTALGPCRNLSSTTVTMNEITSVASAAALATFSADNVQTGNLSYLYVGSSSANASVGLANAFASVNNLVDITTGLPRFFSIAGNAAAPYITINTLADALNACAITEGGTAGDGTACGNLFTYTNPLSGKYPAFAPTDTLQAIFDLLKPPSPGVVNQLVPASVYGMASVSSPYLPILSSAPNEWLISLNYTAGGGVGGSGNTASGSSALAIDASGNVWITNTSINSISEWNSFGASYSPNSTSEASGGFTVGGIYAPKALAIDPSGYVWIVNGNGTLTKLYATGSADANSPMSGGGLSNSSAGIAIDGSGYIWVTNGGMPGSVSKFNGRGIAQSPTTGYTSGTADPSVIAIDGSENIWLYNKQASNSVNDYVELSDTNGSMTVGVIGSYFGNPTQLAIDKSGNVWSAAISGLELAKIPVGYLGQNIGTQPASYPTDIPSAIGNPQGIAFDGSNRLWVANTGQSAKSIASNLSLLDTTISSPSVSISYMDTDLSNGASTMAIDSAGNIWVLLGNNSVKEYVGIATPVVGPISVGVENNKLGTRP